MNKKLSRNQTFLLITVPVLALFFCFNTLPLIKGFIYSFTNFKGYGSYDWVGLREDQYVALFPKDHKFAAAETVTAAQLFEEDLILFKSHEGIDQDVIKIMRNAGVEEVPRYTSNSDFTVIRMVEQQGFVALIPQLIAQPALAFFKVDYRPIDVNAARDIGFAIKDIKRVSPAVRTLLKYAKEGAF